MTNDVGPAALGLGRPGALPAGLVQPCPKPQSLMHKPSITYNKGNHWELFQ